jgi:hypothetical protein
VHRRAALSVVVCAVGSAVGSGPDPSICCEAAARSSVSSLGSARDKVAERGDLSARTGRRVGGAAIAAPACYELAMNRLQPLDLVGLVSPTCCQRK